MKDLADFEQADIGKAAIGVLLGRGDEARNEARPHVGQIGCDRIGERKLGLTAAEQFGLRFGDEGPRHRFDQIARGQRALSLAGAHLDRRQHRLARRVAARKRRRRDAIDADDAHDLFDDVGFALTSGRHDGTVTLTRSPWPATKIRAARERRASPAIGT